MDKKIGYLTIIGEEGRDKSGHRLFVLICVCGKKIIRPRPALAQIKSCGCNQYKNMQERSKIAQAAQPQGTNHGASKNYCITDPMGNTYSGRNLHEFIRQNPNLFKPSDLQWVKGHCRASVGLKSLSGKTAKSWHGWTKGDA